MSRQHPREPRSTRRWGTDPRLIIGVLLVAGSIAGVVGIVAVADETTEVYAATTVLVPGDRVDASTLVLRSVRLDDALGLYLAQGDVPSEGLIVSRVVREGELVPTSAVGSVDGERMASVVLSSGTLAASVVPGAVVDVWAASETEGGGFGPPSVLAAQAIVVRLVESDSIVGGGETTAVELLVPRAKLARVLESIANRNSLSIVPSGLSVSK